MGGPHVLGVVIGQIALLGDAVRDLLDSLRDFLTEGAVRFTDPVACAFQCGPDQT